MFPFHEILSTVQISCCFYVETDYSDLDIKNWTVLCDKIKVCNPNTYGTVPDK